jgi:glyoxylase-like metal-dependent hydrolase (beta-lactamase superfamily II)
MIDFANGIRRETFALPFGIDHVHCYFLPSSDGGWTLVDTGLGTSDVKERWHPVLEALGGPVDRIVITHMHPDHVGGARDLAELTGAPVLQGRLDYDQCVQAWGPARSPRAFVDYWLGHGIPADEVTGLARESQRMLDVVHWFEGPELLEAGDEVDGWRVEVLPGHADGHIALLKDGVMIAGDVILAGITPTVGLYPNSRPDPLGDYIETLERVQELAPRIAYAGHRDPIEDPVGRAREIREHHRERLDRTFAALDGAPRSAYDVSLDLFQNDLSPVLRRFATAESLAHLERLVHEGRAKRVGLEYLKVGI